MPRIVQGIVIFLFGASVGAGEERRDKTGTPAEQYEALAKEFQEAANTLYLRVGPRYHFNSCSPLEKLTRSTWI